MRRLPLYLASLLLLGACATSTAPPAARNISAPVASSPSNSVYVAPGALDLVTALPPPPAAGSPEERAELDQMLRIQQQRTPVQVERVRADATIAIWRFADALGNPAGFDARHLPITGAFFEHLEREVSADYETAKKTFARPRPYRTEPRLAPVVDKPGSPSYPSGHSTWAHTMAIVLADMVPERKPEIFARAEEYGHNRTVAGVHYPSDVEAGKLSGTVIGAALLASPRFRSDEAAASAELRRSLGLPPQPALH